MRFAISHSTGESLMLVSADRELEVESSLIATRGLTVFLAFGLGRPHSACGREAKLLGSWLLYWAMRFRFDARFLGFAKLQSQGLRRFLGVRSCDLRSGE